MGAVAASPPFKRTNPVPIAVFVVFRSFLSRFNLVAGKPISSLEAIRAIHIPKALDCVPDP